VVVDYAGSLVSSDSADGQERLQELPGGEGRDQLIELGAGNLIPLRGGAARASAGEARTVALSFPADYGNEELAGARRRSR